MDLLDGLLQLNDEIAIVLLHGGFITWRFSHKCHTNSSPTCKVQLETENIFLSSPQLTVSKFHTKPPSSPPSGQTPVRPNNDNWNAAVKNGKELLAILEVAHMKPHDKETKDRYDKYYSEVLPDRKEGQSEPSYDVKPILNELHLPSTGYTSVEVMGKPTKEVTHPQKAYDNNFDPKHGVIIADDNKSKDDPNRGNKNAELFLTDIWFQGMAKRAAIAKASTTVKYIFRHAITNAGTKEIIKEAYTRTHTPFKAHKWTLKDNPDEFHALIGTDNGKGVPRILTDYSKTLENYDILSINTFPNYQSDGELRKPTMLFELGPSTAHHPFTIHGHRIGK